MRPYDVTKQDTAATLILPFQLLEYVIPQSQATQPSSIPVNLCPTGSVFAPLCSLGASAGTGVFLQNIFILVLVAAVVLCLIFLIYGGIKWILSQGEKEGVEKAKGTIISALLGLVIVFLSFFIVEIVAHLFIPNFSLSSLTIPVITS